MLTVMACPSATLRQTAISHREALPDVHLAFRLRQTVESYVVSLQLEHLLSGKF